MCTFYKQQTHVTNVLNTVLIRKKPVFYIEIVGMNVDKNYYQEYCDNLKKRNLKHRWKDHFVKYFWPNADINELNKIRVSLNNCLRGKGFISFIALPYHFKDKLEYYFKEIYNEESKLKKKRPPWWGKSQTCVMN